MLPSVASPRAVGMQIVGYTVIVVALTLAFGPVADLSAFYEISAAVLGAVFLVLAVRVLTTPTVSTAMRLFSYSITYVTLLFGAMAVDALI